MLTVQKDAQRTNKSHPTLTNKVLHHGRIVMRRRSQAQQLLTSRHCGVVDGLDVDVVPVQQGVAHLGVQLSITHLENGPVKCDIHCFVNTFTYYYFYYQLGL